MEDNSQNNQGPYDENKIVELEHELEELEKQKKAGESEQKVAGDNQSKVGSNIDDGFEKPASNAFPVTPPVIATNLDGQEALRVQEDNMKSATVNLSSNGHLSSSRKSNLLYYIGIAFMISSVALAALNYLLGK